MIEKYFMTNRTTLLAYEHKRNKTFLFKYFMQLLKLTIRNKFDNRNCNTQTVATPVVNNLPRILKYPKIGSTILIKVYGLFPISRTGHKLHSSRLGIMLHDIFGLGFQKSDE